MAHEQRRLAVIVATDVVGYSRLMGRDEAGTFSRLREHRKQRFEPIRARHGGRLVKLIGDGALAEFPSVQLERPEDDALARIFLRIAAGLEPPGTAEALR